MFNRKSGKDFSTAILERKKAADRLVFTRKFRIPDQALILQEKEEKWRTRQSQNTSAKDWKTLKGTMKCSPSSRFNLDATIYQTIEFQIDVDDRFAGKCTNLCNLDAMDEVHSVLDEEHKKDFRRSCFRKFYHMREMQLSGKLIHGLALRILKSVNKNELWFGVGNNNAARFSFHEFTLIMGLNPEDEALYKDRIPLTNRLTASYFDGANKIIPAELKLAFDNCEEMEDKYKLGLVHVYESILRSKHYKTSIDMLVLNIVDDRYLFNQYPWGRCYNSMIHAFLRAGKKLQQNSRGGGGASIITPLRVFLTHCRYGLMRLSRQLLEYLTKMKSFEVHVTLMATEEETEQLCMQLFEHLPRKANPILDAYIYEDGGDVRADNEEGDDNVDLHQRDRVPYSRLDAAHEIPQASQPAPHVHQPSRDLDFILEGLRTHLDQIVMPRLFNYIDQMEERVMIKINDLNNEVDGIMESMQRYH